MSLKKAGCKISGFSLAGWGGAVQRRNFGMIAIAGTLAKGSASHPASCFFLETETAEKWGGRRNRSPSHVSVMRVHFLVGRNQIRCPSFLCVKPRGCGGKASPLIPS